MPPTDQTEEGALLEPATSPAATGAGLQHEPDEPDEAPGPPDEAPGPPHGGGRRPWLIWGSVAVLAVGGVAAAVLVAGKASTSGAGRSPGGTETPPRVGFVFPLIEVHTFTVTGKPATGDVGTTVSEAVRVTVSQLYDQAMLDPRSWASGPPATAWNAFAPALRQRGQTDASAFTFGAAARSLTAFTVTKSTLSVRVLLDASGAPVSAVADVSLFGTGQTNTGGQVAVTARGTFLLAPSSGHWLIDGYPVAQVTVTPVASPTPAPGPTVSVTP